MGGKLRIFIAFAVLSLALAELKLEGEYNAGVHKLNLTWSIEAAPHASKIQILRNNEKITCKDGVNTGNPHPDTANCTCTKLSEKQGMCSIVANAPANASDEVYVAISCLEEHCTPEVAVFDVYAPITKVGNIKTAKKESGEQESQCVFRGVPAPQITWKTIKHNDQVLVSGKFIKTESTWDNTTKLWETRSTFKTKSDIHLVSCFAQQKLKMGKLMATNMSDTVAINSAVRFGTTGVYVGFSLVYVFLSKSIV